MMRMLLLMLMMLVPILVLMLILFLDDAHVDDHDVFVVPYDDVDGSVVVVAHMYHNDGVALALFVALGATLAAHIYS
jgi:hypothetical protein